MRARFHFFDKWEGESAFLKLDGQAVWTQSYQWCDEVRAHGGACTVCSGLMLTNASLLLPRCLPAAGDTVPPP